MADEQFDLFLILLKLKSYLVSLLDDPRNEGDSLDYTVEFLDRRYPNLKGEILEMLTSYNINTDAEIAFNEKIHLKFKEIVRGKIPVSDLNTILAQLQILSPGLLTKEKELADIKTEREEKLKEIINILIQLARLWSYRSEIENDVEDYSLLEEEELIRPDEEKKLEKIDENTELSFNTINELTNIYMEKLVDYYFNYGGNLYLESFVRTLDEFKKIVNDNYSELFKKHGLDPTKL